VFPEFGDLRDDLLSVGVSAGPFDRGVESIHNRVDLKSGSVVHSLANC
jgi:hypothetical protein